MAAELRSHGKRFHSGGHGSWRRLAHVDDQKRSMASLKSSRSPRGTIQKPSKYDGFDSFSMQTSRRVLIATAGGTRSKKARSGRVRITQA